MKWGSFGAVHFATLLFAALFLLIVYAPQLRSRIPQKKHTLRLVH